MPRKEKPHDTSDQCEESLDERLDNFQATNDSKFGDINATLQRLEDHILTNDNHPLTANEHLQATDKKIADNNLAIDKRFDNVTTKLADTNTTLKHLMSSFDNFARQRQCSRSRSSRSSSYSNHVDDHACHQQPRPQLQEHGAHGPQRHDGEQQGHHEHPQQAQEQPHHGAPHLVNQEWPQADHPPQGQALVPHPLSIKNDNFSMWTNHTFPKPT
jgi:hypothetical protein